MNNKKPFDPANFPKELNLSDREVDALKELIKAEKSGEGWPLPVDRILLYELLSIRHTEYKIKLDDFFLALPAPDNEEMDFKFTILPDQRWPNLPMFDLRVFFLRRGSPWWGQFKLGPGPKICNKQKITYPKISLIKPLKKEIN